jgi:formylglycine-generating enzyme required for sulfatase activity
MKHQNLIKTPKTLIPVERESNPLNIKKRLLRLVLIGLLAFTSNGAFAHGVVVSNVAINGQNTVLDYTLVNFDITWNNSWRNTAITNNWDACWVFVKYRKKSETTWHHATLNYLDGTGAGDGHTAPTGSAINSTSDGKGVMIYSSSNIIPQTVNYTGAKLRWNYGIDGLVDADSVEIAVFAIEMVYVPQGSFYVGDGTSADIQGHFESGTTGTALQITSEGALTLGGGGAGSLGNNNASASDPYTPDDFNDVDSQTLPAAFPKGYNAFYCMKYSISQEQYVAFLNTLTRAQQNTRTATSLAAGTTSVTNRYVMSDEPTRRYRNGIRCDATIHASDPITFYCDYNGNGIPNESDDGQNIACNYLSRKDLAAYLDWAGLRPMTELEYEKACRGDLAAVANEYAWGSASITEATGISNPGANNETASNDGANAAYENHAPGPLRVGNFGQGVNTREGVGASYWCIMELSGNLWERTITVGNITGRAFTGTHGNGIIDANGNADASNCPGTNASGAGFRGGDWYSSVVFLRVSDRDIATAFTVSIRSNIYGGRGVRVCPAP